MKKVIAAFARNSVFANILMMMFFFAGGASAILMVRELFPQMNVDMVTVDVPYPGADPEEVEEGICRKIEEAIDGLSGIKRYTTQAHENHGSAAIEILESYDISKVKEDITSRIDAISTFPVDAEEPIITEPTFTREVISVALFGDLTPRALKEWAETTKDELRALPGVSQVSISGINEYEISIEVSEAQLRQYGITIHDVAEAIRNSNINQPGGTLRTKDEEIRLRTLGRKYRGDEFAKIVVLAQPDGESITLDRLATIKDAFTEDITTSTMNGKPAVLIKVSNTTGEDAIDIASAVKEYVDTTRKTLPEGRDMTLWMDTSKWIKARIRLLVQNGTIGLTLVFILLWLFLDLRLSFWAAMGIPISLAGGLAVLMFTGGTINMISLFGLIMVVGIVVDDAIVVGEAIYVHRRRGDPPLQAAVNGVTEVGIPVFAAVTTTIVAFIPLFFVGGIMGKFIRILPVAVIGCLIISLIECLIMLPSHLSHLPDPNDPKLLRKQQRNPVRRFRLRFSRGLETFINRVYYPFVSRAIRARYVALSIAIAVVLFALGLMQGGFIKFITFPELDDFSLLAVVEFPNGTPREVTQAAVERMDAAIRRVEARTKTRSGEPLLTNVYAAVGTILSDEGVQVGIPMAQPHQGSVRIEMLDSAERGVHSRRIRSEWEKEIGTIPGAISMNVSAQQQGPPGKPIEVWVRGHDMDKILAACDDLEASLNEFSGVSQVESDFRAGKNEIRFTLKPEARALGLTVNDLAKQVYGGFYGEEALRIQRGRDDIRVRVRYPLEERRQLSELDNVRIRTPQGDEVPLRSVADFTYGPGYAAITRTDGMRRVSVSADVDTDITTAKEVGEALTKDYFPELKRRYPGLLISLEGEKQTTNESLGTLFVGFPLALLGIFVIIATIFRSYIQPTVIMFTVPFGIIGAIFGHLLLGYPVTMMSMFGIVALAGVVVNDAIVLIECINRLVAGGMPYFTALARGGARRFRAIFLTTISTVGGLTPMIMEKDMQAQFLIPMALSIAAGVAFATLLTLLLIPCLLGILNDIRRLWRRWRTGEWPTPEEVEPAARRYENGYTDSDPSGDSTHDAPITDADTTAIDAPF